MVLTKTSACQFGWKPTSFNLLGVDHKHYTLEDCMGTKGLVVVFACNHCPYVQSIINLLIQDTNVLKKVGINTVIINSNDSVNYPDDSFENMQKFALEKQFPFYYLHDETQQVAKDWDAVCTPDFFGFNQNYELQYRGRLDSSAKNADPSSRRDLLLAMQEVSETGKGPKDQVPSMGCSIKWIT